MLCYRAGLDNLEIDKSPAVKGIEPRLLDHPAHCLGTVQNMLTRRHNVLRLIEITLVAEYSKRRPENRSN